MLKGIDVRVFSQPEGSMVCWHYVLPAFFNSRFPLGLTPADVHQACVTSHLGSTCSGPIQVDCAIDSIIKVRRIAHAAVRRLDDNNVARCGLRFQAHLRRGWPVVIVLKPPPEDSGTGHVVLLGAIADNTPLSWSDLAIKLYDPETGVESGQPVEPSVTSLGQLWSRGHGGRVYDSARLWEPEF